MPLFDVDFPFLNLSLLIKMKAAYLSLPQFKELPASKPAIGNKNKMAHFIN